MSKLPTSRTVMSGRERRGRIPDASIPDWAAHKRRAPRPVGQRDRADVAQQPSARKRGGAKYGPPPKRDPHPGMQAPTPMTDDRRDEIYSRDGWTARRNRQYQRMGCRSCYRQYVEQYDERADITSAELRGQL